jgi:steroid Delta-isomerase
MNPKEHPARIASQRSMSCSERRSKEEWLSLFADDAIVEDPVGPSPLDQEGKGHGGKEAISTFFDRNIAPSGRKFEIKDSFACGQEVANVGTIHLFLADGREGRCDGVFVYKVNEECGVQDILYSIAGYSYRELEQTNDSPLFTRTKR